MQTQRTPLRYFGQREALVADILLIVNDKKFTRCWDLFSGSGSISFACMTEQIAEQYVLNDSYMILPELWRNIKANPEQVITVYQKLYCDYADAPQREAIYSEILNDFNLCVTTDRSAMFAFLINHAADNMPLFDEHKRLICSPQKNFSDQANPAWFANQVSNLQELFNKYEVTFTSGDFYQQLNAIESDQLVILDPPYPLQSHSIYFNLHAQQTLELKIAEAISLLNTKHIPFILFYGAGDIPKKHQFINPEIDVNHYLRLSEHPLFGKFLEHVYLSKLLTRAKLPANFVEAKILHEQGYNETFQHLQNAC